MRVSAWCLAGEGRVAGLRREADDARSCALIIRATGTEGFGGGRSCSALAGWRGGGSAESPQVEAGDHLIATTMESGPTNGST
jgi:hypothetical protein